MCKRILLHSSPMSMRMRSIVSVSSLVVYRLWVWQMVQLSVTGRNNRPAYEYAELRTFFACIHPKCTNPSFGKRDHHNHIACFTLVVVTDMMIGIIIVTTPLTLTLTLTDNETLSAPLCTLILVTYRNMKDISKHDRVQRNYI